VSRRLAGALAVGLLLGLVKGNDDALRSAIGNLSAPWLLIALVSAWWSGSWWRGALVGTAATLVGLLGFYAGMTLVLHGHFGGASGWLAEYRYVVQSNRIWFVAGVLSGPVLGALGGALGPRRPAGWLVGLAGALMLAELLVVRLVADRPLLGVAWGVSSWSAYIGQAGLGVVLLAAAGRRTLRRHSPS
jgi:hypothetical protein